jgi:5-methylcytosine-specific restriction endonuclease McrA
MPTRYLTTSDGRRIPDPRGTQAWRKLAKQAAREEPVCWLAFEGCTVKSTTGDHVIPVTVRPELALIRSNVHGACGPCNYKRGNLPLESLRLGDAENSRPPALDIFD